MTTILLTIIPCLIPIIAFVLMKEKELKLIKKLIKENENFSQEIQKVYILLDVIGSGICHPMAKSLYHNMRTLNSREIPKDYKDFRDMVQKFSNQHILKAVEVLQERIKNADSSEEANYYQEKLSKLKEIKTMADTIDENSSMEYRELVTQEVIKSISEFNDEDEQEQS